MIIRLIGRKVTTPTSVRYLIRVGRRPGGVTYSQYRLLTILAEHCRDGQPVTLADHFDPNTVADLVSRTRRRLHQINPKCPNSGILSLGNGQYLPDCFIEPPE